jgi:acyl carrier protein
MRPNADSDTIDRVIALVSELTQDWGLDLESPISAETLLAADLEFSSVDINQLCVALEKSYGCRFGFQDLLMKDGSYVGDIALGQFAAFIDARLAEGVAS